MAWGSRRATLSRVALASAVSNCMTWSAALRESASLYPASLEHVGDVDQIFRARFLEALFGLQIVVAVRKTQTARLNVGNHLRRIVIVGGGIHRERDLDSEVCKANDHLLQAGLVLDGIDLGKHRLDWRRAGLVDARLVHAGAVVIPNQLINAALGQILSWRKLRRGSLCSWSLFDSPAAQRRLQRSMVAGIGLAARHAPLEILDRNRCTDRPSGRDRRSQCLPELVQMRRASRELQGENSEVGTSCPS